MVAHKFVLECLQIRANKNIDISMRRLCNNALPVLVSVPCRWCSDKVVHPLPVVPQIRNGRSVSMDITGRRFGGIGVIPPALPDTSRTEESRRRVAGWQPVVRLMSDKRLRVALVGRMNAGKSSIFNIFCDGRYTNKSKQLVLNVEGLTRDCVEGVGTMEDDLFFTAIDTPGVIHGKIVEEALRTLSTADVVLMVCATDQDLSQQERNLAQFLILKKIPALLIVNKMDMVAPNLQQDVLNEFDCLGLGKAIPFSARKRDGLEMLNICLKPLDALHKMRRVEDDWKIEDLAMQGDPQAMEEVRDRNNVEKFIRIAVIGRTNSGKSSLVNRIVGFERTRASETKHTTRDSVEVTCSYRGRKLKLIDTAGMSRSAAIHNHDFANRCHMVTVNAIRFSHICLVVFDATEGSPNKFDVSLLHRCYEEGRPVIFVANKWDIVLDPSATAEAIDFKVKRQEGQVKYITAVVCSAMSGLNLSLLMDQILEHYDTWNKRVRISELNRFWRRMEKSIVISHHISRIHRMKQINTRPPVFLLHLQSKDQELVFNKLMQNTVKNSIIEEFGFRGVPIRLVQDTKDTLKDAI